MAQITKDTIIGDILDIAPETAPIFLSIGMHCLGCPSSRGETVEQAAWCTASRWRSCWPRSMPVWPPRSKRLRNQKGAASGRSFFIMR